MVHLGVRGQGDGLGVRDKGGQGGLGVKGQSDKSGLGVREQSDGAGGLGTERWCWVSRKRLLRMGWE